MGAENSATNLHSLLQILCSCAGSANDLAAPWRNTSRGQSGAEADSKKYVIISLVISCWNLSVRIVSAWTNPVFRIQEGFQELGIPSNHPYHFHGETRGFGPHCSHTIAAMHGGRVDLPAIACRIWCGSRHQRDFNWAWMRTNAATRTQHWRHLPRSPKTEEFRGAEPTSP